jgi:hypothetical protein
MELGDEDSRFKIQSSRFKVQGSRLNVQCENKKLPLHAFGWAGRLILHFNDNHPVRLKRTPGGRQAPPKLRRGVFRFSFREHCLYQVFR